MFSTTELEIRRDEQQRELGVISELVERCIQENAHIAQNQRDYQAKYDNLVKRYESIKAEYTSLTKQIEDLQAQRSSVDSFLKQLKKQDALITEFDDELFRSLVSYITAYARDDVRFTFKDGSVIRVSL